MSEILDKIADAFIHFEDRKYEYHIYTVFTIDEEPPQQQVMDPIRAKREQPLFGLYYLLKFINNDNEVVLNIINQIIIPTPSVQSYSEFIWLGDSLKTAIRRISDNLDNVVIKYDNNKSAINIPYKEIKIYNIKSFVDVCKNYNRKNSGFNVVPKIDREGNFKLLLNKSSKLDNSFGIESASEFFKIDKIIDIESTNGVIAELSLTEIRNKEGTFSIYEK